MSTLSQLWSTKSQPKERVPESDRVPVFQKIAFACGINTESMAVALMLGTLWMPFFNIGMGISPITLGLILMAFRAWDAFTDPYIGNLSDNANTRWGRRKPFMVVGIIAAACVYPLFWYMPASFNDTAKVLYLLGVGFLFFTCTTTWCMPFYGMQLELTPNYDERTRVAMWMSIIGKLSMFVAGWVLAIVTSDYFANPETGEPDIIKGMRTVCFALAGVFLITGFMPILFVKERHAYKANPNRKKETFWASIKDSANCKPLWYLIGASFFLALGNVAVQSVWQYANIYYVFNGDIAAHSILAGWRTTAIVVTSLCCVPIVTWLSEKFDKKPVLIAMLTLMLVSHLLNLFLMTPEMPYLQLISGSAEAMGLSGFWILLPSMKADVADYDELHSGRRREGSINSFYSWFLKAAATLALGLSGFILAVTGFDAKLPAQSEEVVQSLRYAYIFLPMAFWIVSLVIVSRYTLVREGMQELRVTLESRRGKI